MVVVNECIRDGFLEYLTKVRFDEGEGGRFDEEEEGKRRVKGAAQQVLEKTQVAAAMTKDKGHGGSTSTTKMRSTVSTIVIPRMFAAMKRSSSPNLKASLAPAFCGKA